MYMITRLNDPVKLTMHFTRVLFNKYFVAMAYR